MVAVTMENRLIVHAVVSHLGYLPLAIVSGTENRNAVSEHGGFSIQTYIDSRGGVALIVILGFHSVITVLVKDGFAIGAIVGCSNRSSKRVGFVLRNIPAIFYRHRFQVRSYRPHFSDPAFVVISDNKTAVTGVIDHVFSICVERKESRD